MAHHRDGEDSPYRELFSMSDKERNKIKKGDLVATYYLNTSMIDEELLQFGIVLECNTWVGDVLVLDNTGAIRWWGKNRWRLLKKRKN